MWIGHKLAKRAFDLLSAQKMAIEASFGGPLVWDRMDQNAGCWIAVVRENVDAKGETQWPAQHAWFADQLAPFTRAFSERIRQLDLSETAGISADAPPTA